VEQVPGARRARLLLGEVLLEFGRRADAERALMTLIDDYNADRIDQTDGRSLAMAGRAAHLLRSPHDANQLFNEAERVLEADARTLLWRAELFLEKYDPGHAEEVTQEVLERAPRHPEALVRMAQVKLVQALDFDEAARLARMALEIDAKIAGAHFVLAGIALRDMELAAAERRADAGLQHNPRNLELLSLKAAIRFLADDAAGFERAQQAVLKLNPNYTRLYRIIGEYAEWEHRYNEIVPMMRTAVGMDPADAQAMAQLGLNLIRAGEETEGVRHLARAFDQDPFNVRVFNTLNLFEKTVASDYVTVNHERFSVRYHRDELAILERYVPRLLGEAWDKMVESYGFTPSTPVGIELYAERRDFSIRTTGLPHTGIQGVCFGQTVAAVSPRHETFNLGMTLWHELAHVFHIQLSKSRVPRWFTEGLAEHETLAARPEWTRELDLQLYEALRAKRLPTVARMNRAFTRAQHMKDIATAYYASTQILAMLVEQFGHAPLTRMLTLWGNGQRTPQVVQTALGVTVTQLDTRFREYVTQRLARYHGQFIPIDRTGPVADERAAARRAPRDPEKQTRYALAALRAGQIERAQRALAAALKAAPSYPDALWLSVRLALDQRKPKRAAALLRRLAAGGHDGYTIRMAVAEAALARGKVDQARTALEAAHRYDPTMADPLRGLVKLAHKQRRAEEELAALRKLVRLEEHDPISYARLLRILLDRQLLEEARQVGAAAIYVDVDGMQTHQLYAEVLAASQMLPQAIYELESAVLCPGDPVQRADAHAQLAQTYLLARNRRGAIKHARLARQLDPRNSRLQQLKL
jgi:tetratricopeptide (TPR) repeat protein